MGYPFFGIGFLQPRRITYLSTFILRIITYSESHVLNDFYLCFLGLIITSLYTGCKSTAHKNFLLQYYLHAKVDELLDHISARVLPAEWGGEEESIEVITRKWKNRIDENRDFLRNLNEACQRAPQPTADTDIYGTVGAFRKLDID